MHACTVRGKRKREECMEIGRVQKWLVLRRLAPNVITQMHGWTKACEASIAI